MCQATAFGTEAEAARFVAELPAEAAWLSVTVAGVPLAEGASVTELNAGPPEGVRAFQLVERAGVVRHAVVTAQGRFVLSAHVGRAAGAGGLEEAIAILETMAR